MNKLVKCSTIVCLSGAALLQNAVAAEWTNRTTISGFSSAIYQKTNESSAFNGADHIGVGNHGSFNGTRIGININSKVNDKIRLASQFVSSQENNNFSTKLDWAFISIDLTDSLTLRTGKVKYPVGIVNEYRAVGYAYPWITPPALMYSLISAGPQATRESYTGASFLWTKDFDELMTSVDLFTGEVDLESMRVINMVGTTAKLNWQDMITIQGSYYHGEMDPDSSSMSNMNSMMSAMKGQPHSALALGAKAELSNALLYAEYADIDMGNFKMGKGKTWYVSGGYHLGNFLPYGTIEYYEKGKDTMGHSKQYKGSLGMRYDFMTSADLKFELSRIHTSAGTGLFASTPDNADVNMYGISLDVVF